MQRFVLVAVLTLSAPALHAQSARDTTTMLLRGGFQEVSGWISQAATLVSAEQYTYRPTAGVRTVGELLAHIADGYIWYCSNAAGRQTEWSDATEKGPLDKATLQRRLQSATDACIAAYARGSQMPLLQNIGHASLHYGNLVTYLRMMGLTPPSS
ncbi:MAG: DinB family protein [Gemmatimonadaceae bacterium]|nr:DinB family protein [Gemmatimonadaceae bacterium]MCW5826848.1 DinB family protein [Gemmatimonadaceae bacterium]